MSDIHKTEESTSKLIVFQKATAIASSLTIIIGVITALFQLTATLNQANETMSAIKLQALQQITGILDKNYETRLMQRRFLHGNLSILVDQAKKKVNDGASGEDIYLSDDLKEFREIASHYERIGTIIDLKYLNFDVLFDIIPFPDNFWNNTRELRFIIRDNWFGVGRPLGDFLGEFSKLCEGYKDARRRSGFDKVGGLDCK